MQKLGIDEKDFQDLTGFNVANTIFQERLKLHLLLNTPGGSGKVFADFVAMLHCIPEGESETNIYIADKAYSTGALMAMTPIQKRYALPESKLFLHSPALNREYKPSAAEESHYYSIAENEAAWRQDGFTLFSKLFVTLVKPEKRKEVIAALTDVFGDESNTMNEIGFTGKKLHEYGVVTDLPKNMDELRATFSENIKKTIHPNDIGNPLSLFFMYAQVEREVFTETGVEIFIDADGNGFNLGFIREIDEKKAQRIFELVKKKLGIK